MAYLKLYFAEGEPEILENEKFSIGSHLGIGENNVRNRSIDVYLNHRNLDEFQGLVLKPIIEQIQNRVIIRVEWIVNEVIIDSIDGEINGALTINSSDGIQEVLNFLV